MGLEKTTPESFHRIDLSNLTLDSTSGINDLSRAAVCDPGVSLRQYT
jgi:hypothetical protein